MRTLRIGETRGITADGLAYLVSNQTNLRELDISGVCTLLDEEGMKLMPPWVHLIRLPPLEEDKEPPDM